MVALIEFWRRKSMSPRDFLFEGLWASIVCRFTTDSLRPMLAAVPAAKLASFQAHSIAEGGEAATSATEVEENTLPLLHPPTPRGTRFLKSGLAVDARNDGPAVSRRLRACNGLMRQAVSPGVSRAVPLKNAARQGFKAYCLGHCLARCLDCGASVSVSHALANETARQFGSVVSH
jgi:hypothetical protein